MWPKIKWTSRRRQLLLCAHTKTKQLISKYKSSTMTFCDAPNLSFCSRDIFTERLFSVVTEAWQLISGVAIQANYTFLFVSGPHFTQHFSQRALFGCPCMWWAIIGNRTSVQAAWENHCELSHANCAARQHPIQVLLLSQFSSVNSLKYLSFCARRAKLHWRCLKMEKYSD